MSDRIKAEESSGTPDATRSIEELPRDAETLGEAEAEGTEGGIIAVLVGLNSATQKVRGDWNADGKVDSRDF